MALTFWDSEEAQEHNTIMMCSSDVVVYITNRYVDGPVLIVSCSYGYCSFITTKNNWAKNSTMGFGILGNNILLQQMIGIR